MELRSPAFHDSQYIPKKYTCEDDNINPPLEIFDVPTGAVSLVLIVKDPDAPGGDWIHWLVWNIDPQTKEIEKDSVPAGSVEGVTSFGKPGYSGPCPPSGSHVYLFNLYALDIRLPEDSALRKRQIKELMEGHVLDKTILRGFYERDYPV